MISLSEKSVIGTWKSTSPAYLESWGEERTMSLMIYEGGRYSEDLYGPSGARVVSEEGKWWIEDGTLKVLGDSAQYAGTFEY